jgi:hypothetical protein
VHRPRQPHQAVGVPHRIEHHVAVRLERGADVAEVLAHRGGLQLDRRLTQPEALDTARSTQRHRRHHRRSEGPERLVVRGGQARLRVPRADHIDVGPRAGEQRCHVGLLGAGALGARLLGEAHRHVVVGVAGRCGQLPGTPPARGRLRLRGPRVTPQLPLRCDPRNASIPGSLQTQLMTGHAAQRGRSRRPQHDRRPATLGPSRGCTCGR